jgi:hypothetical protein
LRWSACTCIIALRPIIQEGITEQLISQSYPEVDHFID